MSSAGVQIRRNDVISRVPEYRGVSAAICVNALRGPVGKATPCTGEAEFLQYFTPNNRVELGSDVAHWSAITFLQKSSKLWVVRPNTSSKHGGIVLRKGSSGLENMDLNGSKGGTPSGIIDPANYVFEDTDAMIITGKDPGAWNKDISVGVINNATKQADTFIIEVYYRGTLRESHLCSRILDKKNGNGKNIYVENVLDRSNYIRVIDNQAYSGPFKFVPTPIAFTGGTDGNALAVADCITAMQEFADGEGIDITVFLDGGRTNTAYQQALATLAETRGDSIALLSMPYSAQTNDTSYMTDMTTYVDTTLNISSSFAAIFAPHVQIFDRFNNRKIWVSPEAYAGAVISEMSENFEIFYAPAGDNAAINVLDVKRKFSKGQRDILYASRINPLRYSPGKGIRIWGQKTLQIISSYTDRLNVKLLEITVIPAIAEMLDGYVFQFNDEPTRAAIKARIESYMEGIKGRRGCVGFTVVCDESNNGPEVRAQNQINVFLNIEPNTVGEIIVFTTQISTEDSSVSTSLADAA